MVSRLEVMKMLFNHKNPPTHYYVIVEKPISKLEIFLKFNFFRYWYFVGTFEYHIQNQHEKLHLLNIMNRGEPRFNQVVHFWFNLNHMIEPWFTCQKMRYHLSNRPLCLYQSYAYAIVFYDDFNDLWNFKFLFFLNVTNNDWFW